MNSSPSYNILTSQEVKDVFMSVNLKENYNFLEEDLVSLANAFAQKMQQKLGYEKYGHKLMGTA